MLKENEGKGKGIKFRVCFNDSHAQRNELVSKKKVTMIMWFKQTIIFFRVVKKYNCEWMYQNKVWILVWNMNKQNENNCKMKGTFADGGKKLGFMGDNMGKGGIFDTLVRIYLSIDVESIASWGWIVKDRYDVYKASEKLERMLDYKEGTESQSESTISYRKYCTETYFTEI